MRYTEKARKNVKRRLGVEKRLGSKKKRDSKVTVESRTEAVQPIKTDMSKYARAYSNKSKINYADLKLVRPAQTKSKQQKRSSKKQ